MFFAMRMIKHWARLFREVVGYHAWRHLKEVGWCSEQPDLAEGIPLHCRGVGLGDF